MTGERPSEDDLIARWLRPLATSPAALGLGDDCARLVSPAGEDLILKVDSVAQGVHFFSDDPWDLVARKALRVNLSDLAAKGARPLGYLLSLALPKDWTAAQMDALASGLKADQDEFGLSLLGGDTIRSTGGLWLSVTMIGRVPTGKGPSRQQARAGDALYLTGTLGDSALGLKLRQDTALAGTLGLSAADAAHLADRYLLPRPRTGLAAALLAYGHGAMDVSDGLVIDLERMGRVSGTHGVVEIARLPLSDAARAALGGDSALIETILTGGDDYEVLATIPQGSTVGFEADAARAGVRVTRIGHLEAGSGAPRLVDAAGNPYRLNGRGFSHF